MIQLSVRFAIDLRAPERDRREGRRNGEAGSSDGQERIDWIATGNHLHFSMQIDGVQVNPIEWWDEHWIKDHIRNRVNVP